MDVYHHCGQVIDPLECEIPAPGVRELCDTGLQVQVYGCGDSLSMTDFGVAVNQVGSI